MAKKLVCLYWNWIFIQFLYLISLIAEGKDYLDYRTEEEKIELHNVERGLKDKSLNG